ncbi:MAG: hypothetical protein P1U89_22465 [Verrucomicrobiales bacterium]|nr:hypothetical protein [Verrucomicrobiales bacterium]
MKTLQLTLSVSLLFLKPVLAIDYEADILPIFTSKCGKCHMDGSSKGGLALDLDKVAREIGASKAIVPGNPDESELIELVSLPDDDKDKMPPEGKGRPLSAAEIGKIKEWIEAGAPVGGEPAKMTDVPSGEKRRRPDPIDGTWTNSSGVEIKAVLLRVEGTNAVLRKNGKDFRYPIANLSPDSQKIINDFAEAWKASM